MQGLTCSQLCGLLCCPPCPARIAAKLAFLPPSPTYSISVVNPSPERGSAYAVPLASTSDGRPVSQPSAVPEIKNTASPRLSSLPPGAANALPPSPARKASLERRGSKSRRGSSKRLDKRFSPNLRYRLHLNERAEWQYGQRELDCLEVFFARTQMGNRIALMWVRAVERPRFTLLFSHGNAVDLGQMASFFVALSIRTHCHLLSYDYSGYGMSEGRPSERRMYSDANCAWETLRVRCGLRPEQVVLYGQSIGTVPCVDLAARVPCAGVVLHSPLTSGIRVACSGARRTWCCDSFARYEIYEKLQNRVEPLWVEGAGHNDVEMHAVYLERLNQFLESELPALVASRSEHMSTQSRHTQSLAPTSAANSTRPATAPAVSVAVRSESASAHTASSASSGLGSHASRSSAAATAVSHSNSNSNSNYNKNASSPQRANSGSNTQLQVLSSNSAGPNPGPFPSTAPIAPSKELVERSSAGTRAAAASASGSGSAEHVRRAMSAQNVSARTPAGDGKPRSRSPSPRKSTSPTTNSSSTSGASPTRALVPGRAPDPPTIARK